MAKYDDDLQMDEDMNNTNMSGDESREDLGTGYDDEMNDIDEPM